MKKIIIAALAAFVVNANAQTVEGMLKETIKSLKTSQPAMVETGMHTYDYDKDVLELNIDGESYRFTKKIRRNAVSGWGLGGQVGCIQMAENFSPTAGIETTFAGKRFLVGAGIEAAISKYNAESSKAGKSFVAPIFSAKAGIIITRFPLWGYNNMGYISVGYEFKYILDKNENVSGEVNYETQTERITETGYFMVEGNSMCHCGFVEARISLRHMSTMSLGIKLYGGAYNRYYLDGYRRKAMFGGSISLYFNGAKKRTDKNVEKLQVLLEEY